MGGAPARPYGRAMTTHTVSDADAVRAGFAAFAAGDLAAFAGGYHADATWNHRNDDRLGGIHDGLDAILEFLRESGRLTAGTLRAEPQGVMSDGQGRVVVLTRISGTRPDGRAFDDAQVLVFALEDGRVRHVDQYIGDPVAVREFWA
jgi:ketosteroid isomerase-like protein